MATTERVLDKADYQCQSAILANSNCSVCQRRKFCEKFGDFLRWKKINKQ